MNISLVKDIITQKRLKKRDIILNANVSKVTLDKFLQGNDARISTLEAIASALGVSPAIFFDGCESSCEQKPDERVAELQAEVARLKDELLSAQAKIIKLLGDE